MNRGDAWTSAMVNTMRMIAQNNMPPVVNTAVVTNLKPFSIVYKGVTFSADKDPIFVNSLMLDENISLDVDGAMSGTQNLKGVNPQPWISLNTPNADFTTQIEGTIPEFIKSFYNYFKAWHNRYILHVGDVVAVQKVGKNKFIVLQKIQKVEVENG